MKDQDPLNTLDLDVNNFLKLQTFENSLSSPKLKEQSSKIMFGKQKMKINIISKLGKKIGQ